ncbi:GDSL esterase/lipase At5g62930-like isoform X2 [Silene latifolia]|uniref:GDSL esterase/lipase At5g62930-like isoform X2 n=1 Tax=Silene latifolia TaxID=37657 RepID=UPI003D76DB9D
MKLVRKARPQIIYCLGTQLQNNPSKMVDGLLLFLTISLVRLISSIEAMVGTPLDGHYFSCILFFHCFQQILLLELPFSLEPMMQPCLGGLANGNMFPLRSTKRISKRLFGTWKVFPFLSLRECSPSMLVVLITPPPVDEEGRMEYARSLYGEKAMTQPERTNEASGKYATLCVSLAEELGVPYVNLWSKMQEADGWQRKYLNDGLHLTPEGNAVVYKEVVQVFNQGGLSASAMPYDFPHHSEIDPENPEKAFRIQCSSIS